MTSVREAIRRLLEPKEPIPAGVYHYQSPPEHEEPYRLHLRIETKGQGILIVNASTVLHLNQTATEYAYHLVSQTPLDDLVEQINKRYRVQRKNIINDFNQFKENIETLIETPDLDPETFLGFERTKPYPKDISAPYRLDCAITYRLPEGDDPDYAPTKRVDRELTTDEWKSIFEKSWQAGIPHLVITGGEPTLRNDLIELLEFSEHLGQVTGLNTDGLKLLDSSYFDELLQTGLDHLTIVFDSNNKSIWETIPKCINADIFFTIHLTITLKNVVDAAEIIGQLKDLGLKNLSLSASDHTLFSSLRELSDLSAELGLSLIWDLPVPYSAFNPVALELRDEAATQRNDNAWLYIEPDGDVLPTQGVEVIFGNVLADPWEDIWSNVKSSIE
jgi:hypothetical protein